jgi:hypothetical protein
MIIAKGRGLSQDGVITFADLLQKPPGGSVYDLKLWHVHRSSGGSQLSTRPLLMRPWLQLCYPSRTLHHQGLVRRRSASPGIEDTTVSEVS